MGSRVLSHAGLKFASDLQHGRNCHVSTVGFSPRGSSYGLMMKGTGGFIDANLFSCWYRCSL